jgi:hypothetical protein
MDFHEIDTKGKIYIQRVATKPTWEAADVGRIIYVIDEGAFYFASSVAWSLWGSDIIPAGTKMIFYQNTAPTGWTIDGTVADALIAVKGGSNAYNVNGGQLAGTWVQGNHAHTFSDSFSATHSHSVGEHNHQWYNGNKNSWQSDGSSLINVGASKSGNTTQGLFVEVTSANGRSSTVQMYTKDSTGGSTGSADASDTVSGITGDAADAPTTYRPYAAITIVATKN